MKITTKRFLALNPCEDGRDWYLANCGQKDLLADLMTLNGHRPDWARWLFSKLMNIKQSRQIAIFAAEQTLDIFEKQYPEDKRPRKAIEAAKAVLKKDTQENRDAANAAAYAADAAAAYAAANAAYAAAADAAAYAANAANAAAANAANAYAANAAANAAYAAYADAADAAANAADAAANAAAANAANAAAANAAKKEIQEKILLEAVRILSAKKVAKRKKKS